MDEAARVHGGARRSGGVAAGGASATSGESADHRLPRWGRFGLGSRGRLPLWTDCVNSAGSRVAPSRSSIAGRRARPERVCWNLRQSSLGSRSMSLSRLHPSRHVSEAGDIGHTNRLCNRSHDPIGTGLINQFGATGRQRHWTVDPGRRSLPASDWEILREIVPGLRRLAIMADVGGSPDGVREMGEVQTAARSLGH